MLLKSCNKCNETKNITDFHTLKLGKDGYRNKCKKCILSHKKERYWKNADLFRKKSKQYREGNLLKSEYDIYKAMKQRCLNSKSESYKNYGGRGIGICERWACSFKNFFKDMGVKPAGMSLERINNNGNYEPNNCRWATRHEQNANKRQNVKIMTDIGLKCLKHACALYKINAHSVSAAVRMRKLTHQEVFNERILENGLRLEA